MHNISKFTCLSFFFGKSWGWKMLCFEAKYERERLSLFPRSRSVVIGWQGLEWLCMKNDGRISGCLSKIGGCCCSAHQLRAVSNGGISLWWHWWIVLWWSSTWNHHPGHLLTQTLIRLGADEEPASRTPTDLLWRDNKLGTYWNQANLGPLNITKNSQLTIVVKELRETISWLENSSNNC